MPDGPSAETPNPGAITQKEFNAKAQGIFDAAQGKKGTVTKPEPPTKSEMLSLMRKARAKALNEGNQAYADAVGTNIEGIENELKGKP